MALLLYTFHTYLYVQYSKLFFNLINKKINRYNFNKLNNRSGVY